LVLAFELVLLVSFVGDLDPPVSCIR